MTSALETAGNEAVSEVLKAIATIDGSSTQSEILQALLEGAARFASRAAFFLTRPEKVRGWAGEGFGRGGSALEGLEFDYQGPWSALAAGAGAIPLGADECAALSARVDADDAVEGLLIPFVLRGQLGGALYADRLAGDRSLGVSSLLLLTHTASQALETAVFRTAPSPSLRLSEPAAEAPGMRLWQEAPQEPAGEALPASESGPEPTAPAVDREPPVDRPAEQPGPVVEEGREEVGAAEPSAEPEAPEGVSAATLEEPAQETFDEPAFEEPAFEEPALEKPALEEPALEEPAPEEPALEEPAPEEPAAPEPPPGEDEEPALDMGFETGEESQLAEEFAAEPEPELEDSSTDIWALDEDEETAVSVPQDEDEDEDEDDTAVSAARAQDEDRTAPGAEPDAEGAPSAGAPASIPRVGQETVRLDTAALQSDSAEAEPALTPEQGFEPPEQLPAPALEADDDLEPVEAPPLETSEPSAGEGAAESAAFDDGEEPTIITQQPLAPSASEPPPPAAEPAAPAPAGYVPPAPAPEPAAGTSTEVRPPADLQGPGSAFSQTASQPDLTANEEALHEEARRLARLLVSEIKLYNEEIIEEGRRNGDIYERLKDDIDRSRQMYKERIDPRLHGKENYFRQELVQRLAGGDEALLGM